MARDPEKKKAGDIGAMLCTAWGIRQVDSGSNRIYVQNVKPRDFEPCPPFVLEGRPHLDRTGDFLVLEPPGMAQEMSHYVKKGGRPAIPDKDERVQKAIAMRDTGKTYQQIAAALKISLGTVHSWLKPNQSKRIQ
jgi:hypothetical protein